jgi:hypothetical protein
MADLGNLNFGVHLKDYTEQEYEAIKKKLVNMHVTTSAKVGLKVDIKEIEDKVEALLKNKTYKVKLDVDSESIKKLKEAFKGHGVDASELRAMRGVSQIIRADAYVNSQKALEQLRIARMQAAKASDTHNAAMKRTNTTMSSQSRIAGELKNQIANVYSIYTLERFVRGLYTIGGEFQKQRIALTSILGDSMKAETIFNRIKDLAVVSPFQFKELASYTKQLSAYSIPYEELYDTTKRLADISAGVGVDMGRIILAYGQVRSAAFLRGQELRQFTEAGIPLVDELAKRFTKLTGVVTSAGDVFDKISRKEVSFGMVKDVLWDLTNEGGKFYNMQEALAESLAGKWSNLQDAWDVMMADIAESNSGVLSDSLELLTDLMNHWEAVAAILGSLVGAYGFYKTAVIAVNAAHKAETAMRTITFITNLTRARQGLTAVTRAQAVAQWALNAAMKANPWMIAITAVGALAGLYFTLREKTKSAAETIREFNVQVQEQNEKISEAKNKANSYISTMFDTSKAVDARRMAYEKLQGIYPSIFKSMSYEQALLKGQIELLNMSNRAARTTARETARINLEKAYQGLIDAERGVKDAELYSVASDGHIMDTKMLREAKNQLDIARSIVKEAKEDFTTILSVTDDIDKNIKSAWFTTAKEIAGDMNSLIPKDDEAYEEYAKRVKEERENADKTLKDFKKGNPYSEETVRNAQKVFDVSKKIMDTLGVLGKSSGGEKDPIAEQWKARTDLIDKAVSSYEKWRKIEGEEVASQRVKGISEFAPIFDKNGVNLDLKDPSRAYKYLQGQLDRSKEKQEDLYISLGVKIDKAGIDSAKKEVDDALKEIEKYVSQTGEKWDLYKKLFNASGNKSLSMNIAFGGEVSFKSVVDDLRNQLSKALENTGSKFSVTDVLAMKEDDVKKQFGEGVILKLYQSINEESKKMRSESLENLLGMIEDYKDYAQKIKDIERNLQKDLADIESQRGQLGEEATDKLIAQRKKKASEDAASTKFEQFKSSEDWAKTFDDLDRLSSATLSRLIKNLEEFKNTTGQSLKVNEFKELVNVLKKLRDESESRNPFKTLSDGIKEYAEATEKLKKAQKELGFIQDGGEVTTGVSETSHTETKKTDSGLSYQTKVVDKLTPKLKTLADAEKEVTDAQDKQNESSDKVQVGFGDIVDMANLLIGTLGDLGSAFDALGNDSMGDTLSTVQEVAGGLLNTAQSGATLFAGISSGNPMAIMQGATGVVSGITGIIGSIAKAHDKKLDKAIQRSQLEVKKLSNDYKNLQSVIERQLGAVTQSQSKEMIANLQKQQEEVQKQMEAEQDKKDSDASKIEDYKQQYIELGEQIKYFYEDLASEQFGIDLKGWSDQISEALVNAFANGEDAAKAFDDTVADIMRNVIKEMISLNVIKPAMDKLRDYLFGDKGIFTDSSAGGTNLTEQEAAGLMQQLGSLRGTISDSKKIWDYLNAAAKKMGISLEETNASNTLSKGIQENITEETANILASYINGIRADVSVKRALLEKWGNEILPKYNVIAEQQLTQLRAIANNTLRSAQNTEANVALVQEVRDMLSIVIDRSGRKIKI